MQKDEVDIEARETRIHSGLVSLFGKDIVEQAGLIDIADLNVSDEIASSISNGVIQLKKHKGKTEAQRAMIEKMPQGEKLVLCMWIMDMDLLDKL